MAQPRGRPARIAAAPQLEEPGTRFRYDNGGAHLFGARPQRSGRHAPVRPRPGGPAPRDDVDGRHCLHGDLPDRWVEEVGGFADAVLD
jgi:hypothetical protein